MTSCPWNWCVFSLSFSFEANSCFRSSSFPSLFERQRSCDFAQRCYHLVLGGNLTFSSPRSQLNAKPIYTIAIQWNAFSRSSAILYSRPTFLSFLEKYGRHLRGPFVSTRIGCQGITPGIYRQVNHFTVLTPL